MSPRSLGCGCRPADSRGRAANSETRRNRPPGCECSPACHLRAVRTRALVVGSVECLGEVPLLRSFAEAVCLEWSEVGFIKRPDAHHGVDAVFAGKPGTAVDPM